MALFGFGRRPSPERDAARDRVAAWARDASTGGAVVKVNEILCPDPACPGLETVILVMAPGSKTRAVKIAKAAAEVRRDEVEAALRASA